MLYPAELHAQGRYHILSRGGLLGIAGSARNQRKLESVIFGAGSFLTGAASLPLVRRLPGLLTAGFSNPGAKSAFGTLMFQECQIAGQALSRPVADVQQRDFRQR